MAGGGHGEELRQPLDDAEHDSLEVGHPTTSSPPSTPMTFPVIQCVSGCASTTMARATSSGVVRRPLGLRRWRSEEHTSELQSQSNLVCRLLLEKKKKRIIMIAATDILFSLLVVENNMR